ncbi:hypothetical protein KPB05_37230 [Burkholderia gladioli]|uniref:replication protein RepA n=1 Tax=Burkholderia gladioli TaxID=28095 RepID=UPI0028559B40|nr:replication protein RepA [Burkholderia gladioli]MDR8093102.1 hypothetical protein [Burkholderia gladioli]
MPSLDRFGSESNLTRDTAMRYTGNNPDAVGISPAVDVIHVDDTRNKQEDARTLQSTVPSDATGRRRPFGVFRYQDFRMASRKPKETSVDFRSGQEIPKWMQEAIDAHLAIEAEDVKSAGATGFMARALVLATMPYKDPKRDSFTRTNGDFKLRIVAGYEGGIPYGIYPRLLMSWVATEAVRKQSPIIELGDSLRIFLRDVLELRSSGGGPRGSGSRVSEQMKRLFGAFITAQYTGGLAGRGFSLRNVSISDELDLSAMDDADYLAERPEGDGSAEDGKLWTPQSVHEAGQWRSRVRLSDKFFTECTTSPVPIDLRAYKALRHSPLAMDIYTWLTYRMSYTERRTRPIPWVSLMNQFGAGFNSENLDQAVRDFKKAFLKGLEKVRIVYPQAQIVIEEQGPVLLPSPPHVPRDTRQGDLFLE